MKRVVQIVPERNDSFTRISKEENKTAVEINPCVSARSERLALPIELSRIGRASLSERAAGRQGRETFTVLNDFALNDFAIFH